MLIIRGRQKLSPFPSIYPWVSDFMYVGIVDTLCQISTPRSASIFIVSGMNAYLKCGSKTKERLV